MSDLDVLPVPLPRRNRLLVTAAALTLVGVTIGLVDGGTLLLPREAPKSVAPEQAAVAAAHAAAVARAKAAATTAINTTATTAAKPATNPTRIADASRAAALFSTHSWHVEPPPPPPPGPPPPPPPPAAPPFPYTFMGAFTPQGDKTVYFLARADRVIDVHVGDQLDGVYGFESADANQLVFNYLPLNIRQFLPAGQKP